MGCRCGLTAAFSLQLADPFEVYCAYFFCVCEIEGEGEGEREGMWVVVVGCWYIQMKKRSETVAVLYCCWYKGGRYAIQ